jgi:hypothetical protein
MTQPSDSDTDSGTEFNRGEFTVGDVVDDRERDDLEEYPVVVNLPPIPCSEWDAYEDEDGKVTVADDNPGYDPDAGVVVVMFPQGLDKWGVEWSGNRPVPLAEAPQGTVYGFPPGRLEPTGATYGAAAPHDSEAPEESEAADDSEALDESGAADESPSDEADAEATLRDRLDAIADTVGELNVDDVAVDTFREVVVVEKLGKQYAIDTDGTVDADDLLAGKLEDALDESAEVGE